MQLRHQHSVDASVEHMWSAFTDLYRVGACFPGAQVTKVDGTDFVGALKVAVGPLTLTYDGEGTLKTADESARHAVIVAKGSERHGLGKADITIDLRLTEISARRTQVDLKTGIEVRGLPTSLGGGLGQRVSDPLIAAFVHCLAGPKGTQTGGPDEPLSVLRTVLPGLVGSYGRSLRRGLGRKD